MDYGLITCCSTAWEFKVDRQVFDPWIGWVLTHSYSKMHYSGQEGTWWTKMVWNNPDPGTDRHRFCRRSWYWDGANISNPTAWNCRNWVS